jgi:hypothetical protein
MTINQQMIVLLNKILLLTGCRAVMESPVKTGAAACAVLAMDDRNQC